MLPLHHNPRMLVGRIRFNRAWSMLSLLVSSGSPESRTQRYAVISRVRATGPRLPFVNVVIVQVGTAGLEPALSCSHDHAAHGARRAAAALHPVIQSERADLNRRSPGPPPTARVPGRDNQASPRSAASSPCGSRTRLPGLKGRSPRTDRRTSRHGRAPSTQTNLGLARGFHAVDWAVLESASTAFQAAAKPSQLPVQQKSPMSL